VTIKDIARESGYAISTVSRALNDHPDVSEEAKARIRQVVEARGFVPNANARKLKQTEAKTIVFLVKSTANMFFAGMLVQLQQLVSRAGYDGVVQYLDEDGDEVVLAQRLCRELKPRGVIFLGGSAEHFRKGFSAISLPCVLATVVSEELNFDNLSMVGVDDRKAGAAAIDHLLANGHRDILILGADPAYSNPSYKRLQGCNDSFTAHGMELAPRRYLKTSFSFDAAYQAMDIWLKEGQRPQAVFAMSDTTAIGAIRALNDHGLRVPEDVSVIGFDGVELANFYTPRLCTMRQPSERIARASVELLLGCIEKKQPARTLMLEAELVFGESVAERK